MNGTVLDQASIASLVAGSPPLVEGYLSLNEQLQPNGFDLTLRDVNKLTSPGAMGRDSEQRELSGVKELNFDQEGWLQLSPGSYLITFNEIINLPLDLMALGRPRSSLLRSGVSVHTAVWDAGYRGRSQALLVAHHSQGYRVQQGASLLQLVFFRLAQPADQGYQGKYLEENL